MNIRTYKITIPAIIIVIGILLRSYIAFVIKPVTGDSAVFALMAKHVSEMKEFYIYMPLSHYAGALSGYIGAIIFKVLGVSYNSFISVGLLFSSAGLIAGCILSRKTLDSFGEMISDTFIAIPSFLVIWYSLLAGVHTENALFIPLLLLVAVKINAGTSTRPELLTIVSGVISGIALWSSPSTIPVILTIITLLLFTRHQRVPFVAVILFFAGLFLGYAPSILYNFQHPHATLFRMAGRILNLDRSALESPHLSMLIFKQICWRISTVPDSIIRIPRLTTELISFPGMLLFYASAVIVLTGRLRRWFDNRRLDGIGVILLYAFWFVVFYSLLVGEGAARYAMGLVIIAPLLIGAALSRIGETTGKFLVVALVASLIYFNVSNVRSSAPAYSSERYVRLADWLIKNNELRGYSDYDTAYITGFESLGKAIISPTLFHPTFADRWPDETKVLRSSQDVCYIIDTKRYAGSIRDFETNLAVSGVPVKAHDVGDFTVYRNIPGSLRPDELISVRRN